MEELQAQELHWDAASRGLSVALIEKKDFAYGTSSRSTKLIHGGLRYLKQLEIALVHEVGRERAILHKNAPHLVIPEKMLLPIVEDGSLQRSATSFALWVYDVLAGVKSEEKRVMLSKADTLSHEPLLRDDIVLGGGLYYEYRTDDARLVIETMKTAIGYGALCLNYVEAVDFNYYVDEVKTVNVKDAISGEEFAIKAERVVNAAGPWVDLLRKADNSLIGKRLQLTKGVHVVVPYEKLPIQQSIYFDNPEDGRMIFAIPRNEITYIGTTDTVYNQSIDNPTCLPEDVEYVLNSVNNIFPSIELTIEDVQSSWAGLRPLIHEDGKSPSELSRKDEIFHSKSGLISIAGGKLTGYRMMAKRVVDLVVNEIDKKFETGLVKCKTRSIKIGGGDFDADQQLPIPESNEFTDKKLRLLFQKYGTQLKDILEIADELKDRYSDKNERLILAELEYCIRFESVASLSDFIVRRSGMLYFQRDIIDKHMDSIQQYLYKRLDLPEAFKETQHTNFEEEYEQVVSFKSSVSN